MSIMPVMYSLVMNMSIACATSSAVPMHLPGKMATPVLHNRVTLSPVGVVQQRRINEARRDGVDPHGR